MQPKMWEGRYRVFKVGKDRIYWTGSDWSPDPDQAVELSAKAAYQLLDELNKNHYSRVPPYSLEYLGSKKIR